MASIGDDLAGRDSWTWLNAEIVRLHDCEFVYKLRSKLHLKWSTTQCNSTWLEIHSKCISTPAKSASQSCRIGRTLAPSALLALSVWSHLLALLSSLDDAIINWLVDGQVGTRCVHCALKMWFRTRTLRAVLVSDTSETLMYFEWTKIARTAATKGLWVRLIAKVWCHLSQRNHNLEEVQRNELKSGYF